MKRLKRAMLAMLCLVLLTACGAQLTVNGSRLSLAQGLSQAALLLEQGRYQEAMLYYEAVLEVEPNRFEANFGMAQALEGAGEFVRADAFYRAAQTAQPDDAQVRSRAQANRAQAGMQAARSGDVALARTFLDEVAGDADAWADVTNEQWMALLDIVAGWGDPALLGSVLAGMPARTDWTLEQRMRLAEWTWVAGDERAARDAYEAIARDFAGDAAALQDIVAALIDMEAYDLAERIVQDALAAGLDGDWNAALAQILLAQGRVDDAVALLSQEGAPHDVPAKGDVRYVGAKNAAGQAEGNGVAYYHSGAVYIGGWKDGLRSGYGVFVCEYDGLSYRCEGQWENDLPEGEFTESEVTKMHTVRVGTCHNGFWIGPMDETLYIDDPISPEHQYRFDFPDELPTQSSETIQKIYSYCKICVPSHNTMHTFYYAVGPNGRVDTRANS